MDRTFEKMPETKRYGCSVNINRKTEDSRGVQQKEGSNRFNS
jgi:hypothetical protein